MKTAEKLKDFGTANYDEKLKLLDMIPVKVVAGVYADMCTDEQLIQLFEEWFKGANGYRGSKNRKKIRLTLKALNKKGRDVSFLDDKYLDIS